MADNNKVLFGFKNLYVGTYAVVDGTVTLGTPYHQRGAVGFSPEADESESNFYADDIAYFTEQVGRTRSGDLEVAKFDDKFKTDFLGYRATSGGGLAEVVNPVKPNVYIMFEVSGDAEGRRVIMYNGSLGSINREYQTIEENREVVTESISATFTGDEETGIITATYKPSDEAYATLFSNPPVPAFAGA